MNHTTRTISLSEDALHLDILGMKLGTPYLLFFHGDSRKSGRILESGRLTPPSVLCTLSILKIILEQLFKGKGKNVQVRGRARLWLLFKEDVPGGNEDRWVYLVFSAKQETVSGCHALAVSKLVYEDMGRHNCPLTVPRRLRQHVKNNSFIRFEIPRYL